MAMVRGKRLWALVLSVVLWIICHLSPKSSPEMVHCKKWMNDHKSMSTAFVDPNSRTPDLKVIRDVRVFDHCVFNKNLNCDPLIEMALFPWMTEKPPLISHSGIEKNIFTYRGCLTTSMKLQLKGKGIVMTAGEIHFKELTNLVTLLRVLEVNLPIQVIHRGDISKFTQKALTILSGADLNTNSQISELLDLSSNPSSLPQINISFVDISPAIKPEYEKKFHRFTNKVLAYLFNSFEEIILIDVDTVPLVPLQNFFEFGEYLKTGTFFFRDRALINDHKYEDSLDVFKSLLPTFTERQYGISPVTSYTLSLPFFKGFMHLQESGVVLLNRRVHFQSALMAATLALHENSIMDRIWGDKELYWLSLVIEGDENYYFNANPAAAVGEIPTDPKRTHYPELQLTELCSNHPAHIAGDNHTLLWMNTGFKFCKKLLFGQDNPFFDGLSIDDIIRRNKSPLRIRQALIPPSPVKPGVPGSSEKVPLQSWIGKSYCESYTVCAYNEVGDQRGVTIEFTEEEQRRFDHLGQCWINAGELLRILIEQTKS